MTKELEAIAVVDSEIVSQHIKATPYGLEITGKPSTDEWYETFQKVSKYHGMSQFYLGDLVVCAEYEWGDKYTELIDLTGYAIDTLGGYATVARRFTTSFRNEFLCTYKELPSYSAFQRVASIKEDERAMYYLGMVVNAKWSIRKLEEEVKRYKNGGSLPETVEEPVGVKTFKDTGKDVMKRFFNDGINEFIDEDKEYNEVTWLLEMKEWIEKRLEELAVVDE